MVITDYYGRKHGTTCLEIYFQPDDGSERIVHRQLRDQAAYDAWHLTLYFKEILTYKRLLMSDEIAFAQIPRKEKNLLLYLILACEPRFKTILELGSSLFEMIEGLQLIEKYTKMSNSNIPVIELKKLSYTGVEISELLSFASIVLHPGYEITIYHTVTEVEKQYDIFYDRSVTSYAFQTSKEVADFINLSKVALLNLFLSKEETFTSSRLGKQTTYFSLKEIVTHLNKPLYHLFGEKAPGGDWSMGKPVVEGFFLCCQPDLMETFKAMAQRDAAVKAYFDKKQIVPKDALTLLE